MMTTADYLGAQAKPYCRICYGDGPVNTLRICDVCYGSKKSRHFADYMDLWETDQMCTRCPMPLHVGNRQDFPFCPNCAADAINAKRGRELLNRYLATKSNKRTHAFVGRLEGIPL